MKVCVLGGSPKGELSVTLQSVRFLEKTFKEARFTCFHVGQTIRAIVEKEEKRQAMASALRESDLVLLATPVYSFTVPSQFKRFVELCFATSLKAAVAGKPVGIVTTSVNFFDHIAHGYLRGVCEDLGMRVVGSFSADSYDLLDEGEQGRLFRFGKGVFHAVETGWRPARRHAPLSFTPLDYRPQPGGQKVEVSGKRVVIVQDEDYTGRPLGRMIDRVADGVSVTVDRIVLSEIRIAGPCLGCIECGFDHRCAYTGKDDYIATYETRIKTADILIFAGEIRDRMLSWKWKEFLDRGFYNTHTPTLTGKQVGWLLSGPATQLGELSEMMDAFVQWQGANLVDVVTDEVADSATLDAAIDGFLVRAAHFSETGYVAPSTFLGKAGMKVFRDDVFGRHRFVFQADHQWFSENGVYDYPHDDTRIMETNAFMFEMMKDANAKEAIRKMLKTEMVKPIRKIIDKMS